MAYDYVIAGAGSAGCLLANRLSADPEVTVLLLEAGGEDTNRWIHIPAAFAYLLGDPTVDWCYRSEPEPYLDGRVTMVPRGKVLGGTSSINAMCYIRGVARDYDGWRDAGNPGWGWAEVRPHFEAVARELGVQETRVRWPVIEAWRHAALEHGIREIADFNQGENEGMAYFQGTIRNGRRSSSAEAFLHPVRHRQNLVVIPDAHVTSLMLTGRRVSGVTYLQDGRAQIAEARIETIVSAGAIGSPQLLQISGVGPPSLLQEKGIPVVLPLNGVGENLQDHWQVRMSYKVRNTVTMNQWVNNPLRRYAMGLRWLVTRGGPVGTQTPQLCAFVKSDPAQVEANLQYHVTAASAERFGGPLHPWPALSLGIAVLRPQSVGHCRIKSADPFAPPAILHNFLKEEAAQRVAIAAVRQARSIAARPPLAPFSPEEFAPGAAVQSDDEILAYARKTVFTVFHQSGTCRMGRDPMAVVDARLRVHGLQALRVVDASVMPFIPCGNTNAPTMMIAEKAAAMIREDRRAA